MGAQELIFHDQPDFFCHALQDKFELFHAKGFGHIVVSAELHRLHCALDRAVPGHDGHFRARLQGFDPLQELHARHAGQHEVGQDYVWSVGFQ